MKNAKFSYGRIMGILRQAENGVPVSEQRQFLQMARKVWRNGCVDDFRDEGDGRRKPSYEAHVC